MKKKQAYCIHHTHWDPIWYFSAEEAVTQFVYNMKELFSQIASGRVNDFFLDGQTAALEDYLRIHPEDTARVRALVEQKKLVIGPFHSQLDCFISSGEAIIQNLRLGMRFANRLGGSSNIAYLPDSFGHTRDFPKIFNLFGIEDFVITRGVGDEYGLKSEFYFEADDGSRVLVHVMLSGYGYGTYGFRDGTLLTHAAEDYNKLQVHPLIDRLISYSSLDDSFVFPIGFDQNPVILDIEEKIRTYNRQSDAYHFVPTNWAAFMALVRAEGKGLKTYQGELMSTQYHRIHRSIFSARADIKILQDHVERLLTFEVQPLMALLDSVGVPYDAMLLDDAWETLIRCQTHASATMTDETNAAIKALTLSAKRKATAIKIYLMKVLAISKPRTETQMPLIIYYTLPYQGSVVRTFKIYTKSPTFTLKKDTENIPYTIIEQYRLYGGVVRRDTSKMNEDKHYYETKVVFERPVRGIAYETLHVDESPSVQADWARTEHCAIENDFYRIDLDGGLVIYDKRRQRTIKQAFVFEDSGDAGDNYDYSPPEADWLIYDDLSKATKLSCVHTPYLSIMTFKSIVQVPKDLPERQQKKATVLQTVTVTLTLKKSDPVIGINVTVDNQANQHRLRLVFKTAGANTYSYAGTQYGIIPRETEPKALADWVEKNYFEAPTPEYPLLNHVSAIHQEGVTTVYTRSVKEYEFIDADYASIAVTLWRSVGHLGLPDLQRRPGRPSGLAHKIFATPDSQLHGTHHFELALSFSDHFDGNQVANTYVKTATDLLYYQHQSYHTTVFNMAYFPTNPLEIALPDVHQLLMFEEGEAVFGALLKSTDNQAYLARLYNTKSAEVHYTLAGHFDETSIEATNLNETPYQKETRTGRLTAGQLKILRLPQKR